MISQNAEWPRCAMCEAEMVAYLELMLPQSDNSPFQTGSRLQIFGCQKHCEMAGTIYSDYERFEEASQSLQLPEKFWEISDGHYCVRLLPPSETGEQSRAEGRLIQKFIVASEMSDEAADGFKYLGEPYWFMDPEEHTCSCGAKMQMILQIPENYPFEMAEGAERQADSFSHSDYCLFLGNQLYLLGCTQQCHPLALWPVLQG